jgi:hypothetical protein
MAGEFWVKTRFALLPGHDGAGVKSARSVLRGVPKHGVHKNVWGFADLTLEFSRWPPHIGTAAGKHGAVTGAAGFPAQAVGRRSDFGLFAVREMNGCDGRVR